MDVDDVPISKLSFITSQPITAMNTNSGSAKIENTPAQRIPAALSTKQPTTR